jgi:hypothetical protein
MTLALPITPSEGPFPHVSTCNTLDADLATGVPAAARW